MDPNILKLVAGALSVLVAFLQVLKLPSKESFQLEAFENIKTDPGLYYGEGWADIKKDMGETKTKAKLRALQDLSQNMEVQIKTTFSKVLGPVSSDEQFRYESKINSFTKKLTTSIDLEACRLDYPKKNQIACVVAISKEKYRKNIQKEIEAKKKKIVSSLESGVDLASDGEIVLALEAIGNAAKILNQDFAGLIVSGEVKGKEIKNIRTEIQYHQNKIFNDIQIIPLEEKIPYSKKGIPRKNPELKVFLKRENKNVPLAYFSLKSAFIENRGRVAATIQTDENGLVTLKADYIDPYQDRARLKISPDWDDFAVLSSTKIIPSSTIEFFKVRPLAISVVLMRNGRPKKIEKLTKRITTLLEKGPYQVKPLDLSLAQTKIDPQLVGADYILAVHLKISTNKHPDFDLFNAKGRAEIFLQKENNQLVFQDQTSWAEEFGGSTSSAVNKALGKVQNQAIRLVKKRMEKLH